MLEELKSDLRGIETCVSKTAKKGVLQLKSDLRGIETAYKKG